MPPAQTRPPAGKHWIFWLTTLTALAIYLLTLAPGLTWAYGSSDGGDLMTAAATLGIPHPPGYPLYTLLGWLITRLPFGEVAWRFNVFSALSMALAVGLMAHWLFRNGQSAMAAVGAAGLLAFTPLVWSQAIVTEVYALSMLAAVLLFILAPAAYHSRKRSFGFGLALILGLSTHLTLVFLVPALLYHLQPRQWTSRNWQMLLAGGLCGLLVFLYLPLRSGQGAITWGTPHTLTGFVNLLSGRLYQTYLFALPWQDFWPRLAALLGHLAVIGLPGLLLIGLGLYQARRQHPGMLSWYLISLGLYLVYALGYNSRDSFVYLLPVCLLLTLLTGYHIDDILAALPEPGLRIPGLLLVAAAPLWLLVVQGPAISLRGDDTARRFLDTMLTTAPPNAILLSNDERMTFALWYGRFVVRERVDITPVDTRLAQFRWHQRDIRRLGPDLGEVQNLMTAFQRGEAQIRPLCTITEHTFEDNQQATWNLNCLSPNER